MEEDRMEATEEEIADCVRQLEHEHQLLFESRCDNPYIVKRLAELKQSEEKPELMDNPEFLHEYLLRSPPPKFPTNISELVQCNELKPRLFLLDEQEKQKQRTKKREGGETLSDKDFPTQAANQLPPPSHGAEHHQPAQV